MKSNSQQLDLSGEIQKRKQEAALLEQLSSRKADILQESATIDHQIAVILQPNRHAGKVMKLAGKMQGNGKKLADIMIPHFASTKNQPLNVEQAAEVARNGNYHSKSKNFNMVVRGLFKQDKRFKEVHHRGSRRVEYCLTDRALADAKKAKQLVH